MPCSGFGMVSLLSGGSGGRLMARDVVSTLKGFAELFLPALNSQANFFLRASGREFPHVRHFGSNVFEQGVVIERAGERHPMILMRPDHIVYVGSDQVRLHLREPLIMFE